MDHFNVKSKRVAELLDVKDNTVRVWRCEIGRDIPDTKLELLRMKLEAQYGKA